MNKNIVIPKDLFIAANHLCTGSELKIIFALLGCDSKINTVEYMLKLTGITQPSNYFRERKKLIDIGYIYIDDEGAHVDVAAILNDYDGEI